MKRSEPNRGDSQLKRTPMKKRRTRHRDTPESLKLRADYRADFQYCEVSAFLSGLLDERASTSKRARKRIADWLASIGRRVTVYCPVQVDHIWGTGGGRLDLWSMLISVDAAWHEWKTANATVGRLLFVIVKANKKPPEVNDAEFCQCSGRDSLAGWLTMDDTIAACPDWLDPFRLRLLKQLESAK